MHKLFVYGSLMYEEVWYRIINGRQERFDALLEGYKRVTVNGESYPGIRKAAGSSVPGILVTELNKNQLRLLDKFEGRLYKRQSVTVYTETSGNHKCETYVIQDRAKHRLSNNEWCENKFREKLLLPFSGRYVN